MKKIIGITLLILTGCSNTSNIAGEITTAPYSLDDASKQNPICRSDVKWVKAGIPLLLKDQSGVILGSTHLSSGEWDNSTIEELTDIEIRAAKNEGVDPTDVWARCKFAFLFTNVPISKVYQLEINYIDPYVIPYDQVKESDFYLELSID